EHAPLAIAEPRQRTAQGFLSEVLLRALIWRLGPVVGDELTELRLLLVADRLLERYRRLRRALYRLDLLGIDPGHLSDLLRGRLASQLGADLAFGPPNLVELLDYVHRHADRPCLVGQRAGDRLADPPGRVGG